MNGAYWKLRFRSERAGRTEDVADLKKAWQRIGELERERGGLLQDVRDMTGLFDDVKRQRDRAMDQGREALERARHWKARAEHLASEKSEADMRYADTRWLLEGMARRASVLRRCFRQALGGDWYDQPVNEQALADWERELIAAEAQRESVADAAEGDEAAEVWVDTPDDAPSYQDAYEWQRVKVRAPRQWTKGDPEPNRGEFIGDLYGRQWVRDGHGWVRWADTHRIWKQWDEMAFPVVEVPAPSEREGDKQ